VEKANAGKSGDAGSSKKSYIYSSQLQFLKVTIEERPTSGNNDGVYFLFENVCYLSGGMNKVKNTTLWGKIICSMMIVFQYI